MGLLAARKGYHTLGIDVTDPKWPYYHQDLVYSSKLPRWDTLLRLIINCSVVEHVGLGRYGEPLEVDGDLRVIGELRGLLIPGGTMLMTTSVGKDKIVKGVHRIYGKERLSRLLENWTVKESEYWMKDSLNKWIEVPKETALNVEGNEHYTAVGLFVLGKE